MTSSGSRPASVDTTPTACSMTTAIRPTILLTCLLLVSSAVLLPSCGDDSQSVAVVLPTVTSTAILEPTASVDPALTRTALPIPVPTPTLSALAVPLRTTSTAVPEPTSLVAPTPTHTALKKPSPTATPAPAPAPTIVPTPTHTATPAPTSTPVPTNTPTLSSMVKDVSPGVVTDCHPLRNRLRVHHQ